MSFRLESWCITGVGFLLLHLASGAGAQSAIDRIVNHPNYSTTYEAGKIVNSQRETPAKGHLNDVLKAGRWQQVYGAGEEKTAGYTDTQDFIRQIQAGLADWGAELGVADGVMGPKTEAAIREYQSANGMTVTGKPSVELYKSLQKPVPTPRPVDAPAD